MRNGEERKNTIFSLMAALVLISAVIVFRICLGFKPFCTNDVVLMKSFANGTYNGVKDGHLVFTMYSLGEIFVFLYTLFPKIEWYDIFMLGVHFISWFLIIYKISDYFTIRSSKVIAQVCMTFVIVATDLKYVIFFEFVGTAGILGAAGILYLAHAVTKEKKFDYVISGITLLLSFWIRKQVFYITLPFIFLLFLSRLSEKRTRHKQLEQNKTLAHYRNEIIWALCLLIGIGTSFGIEKIAYSSDAWNDYAEYNAARCEISDYYGTPEYDQVEDILSNYGISESEYIPFTKGSLIFSSKFSTEVICKIAEYAGKNGKTELNIQNIKAITKQMFIEWYLSMKQFVGIVIAGVFAANMIFAIRNKKYGSCVWAVLGIMYECAFICYFIFQGRYPEKVSHVLYIMQMLFQMSVLYQIINVNAVCPDKVNNDTNGSVDEKDIQMLQIKSVHKYFYMSVIGICIMAFSSVLIIKEVKEAGEYTSFWTEYLEEGSTINNYCLENSGSVFIVSTSIGNWLCDYMLDDTSTYAANIIYLGFWTADSPLLNRKLEEYSIYDISEALIHGENVYYIQREEEDIGYLTDYYASHGLEVHTETVEELNGARGKNLVLKIKAD